MVTNVTEHQWYTEYEDDVFNQDQPIAIIFSAEWCESCHRLIDRLDSETFSIPVINMDVDNCATFSDELGITSLPTVVVYQHGDVSMTFSNNTPIDDIIQELRDIQ